MNKKIYQFILLLAGSFVCLYLTFAPAVTIPYTTHDSIRFFHKFYNKENESLTYPQYRYEYNMGRPITAELEGFLYKKIDHLSDLSWLRLATIFVFALSASLLSMTAVLAGMETIPAFCLCTVIFTLPGIQDFIFVPYLTNALAVLLSILAYIILTKKLLCRMQFIFTFILLEVSFCLYPPSTFFFLFPASLMVLFHEHWQFSRKIWVRDIVLWILVAGVNYFILSGFFYKQMKSSGHEIVFTLKRTLQYAMTFIPLGLPQTFNFWNIYYSKTLGILMMIFVAGCLLADVCVIKKIGRRKSAALMTIFLISNLIWFLFGSYQPREYMVSQALALTLVYWCGEWIGNILNIKRDMLMRVWPIAVLCVGLIIANQMATSNVLNNFAELMFMRSRIAQSVNSATEEIHVIHQKDRTKGYNGLPTVYDNFNSTISDYETPDLVRVALKDMGEPFELHCIVTYSDFGQPLKLLPNAVVIDMNDLVYIWPQGQK